MTQGKRTPDKDVAEMFSKNLNMFIGKGKKWATKEAFATSIGTSGTQVTNYLKGSLPQADVLLNMSKAIKCSMEWLVTGEEKANRAMPPDLEPLYPDLEYIYSSENKSVKDALALNIKEFKNDVKKDKRIEELEKKVDFLMELYKPEIKSDT